MRRFKKGSTVRCAYRGNHVGVVLSWNDPRAWAGTIAFPEPNPDASLVRKHVRWCHSQRIYHRGDRPRIPVLYAFGVRWDSQLIGVA